MVTPVYDYDGPVPSPPPHGRSDARERDSIYTYAIAAAEDVRQSRRSEERRLGEGRSHSASRYSSAYFEYDDDDETDQSNSPASYYAPNSYKPTRTSGDRARPPTDPLAQNPPQYQVQAMQGYPSTSQGRPRPQAPYSVTLPHQPGRVRPSGHPLVLNPPNYQTQAVQGGKPQHSAPIVSQTVSGHGKPTKTHTAGPLASQPVGTLAVRPAVSGKQPKPGSKPPLFSFTQTSRFDMAVQDYLRKLPMHPEFCLSRCSGRKRAVCIGINYTGQRDELRGCANDARHMRDFLIQKWNFPETDILVLTDDDKNNRLPTRKEIFQACMWLVQGAKRDDSLFFHYSGHGGQAPDESGKELDGLDEVIFPLDHEQEGDIIDDEMFKALVQPLPAGCRLTAIFDSCHSGTILDLPYVHSAHGRLRSMRHISRRAMSRGTAPPADVICFAACRDDEQSADTFHGGVAVGAMSYALIKSFETQAEQTYGDLLSHLRKILVPKYGQKAQISGTHPLKMDEHFSL